MRAASVPMMAALAAWLLFEALQRKQQRWLILAGAALGLSLYTYPAARALPIVYLLFLAIYSVLTHKVSRSMLITLAVAFLVFAPLGYIIATLPEADVRLQQLGGPVQELAKGNVEPVLRYTFATLGMFNVAGDPIARYNVPGRPVFDAITGLLFLVGIGLALRQWHEPRNLFALIWLPIGLLPSMLSDSAPSFLRASASLPVTFLFPALAVDWLFTRVTRPSTAPLRGSAQDARRMSIGYVLAIGLIVLSSMLTIRDYFFVWPNRADVREVYRSDLAAADRVPRA